MVSHLLGCIKCRLAAWAQRSMSPVSILALSLPGFIFLTWSPLLANGAVYMHLLGLYAGEMEGSIRAMPSPWDSISVSYTDYYDHILQETLKSCMFIVPLCTQIPSHWSFPPSVGCQKDSLRPCLPPPPVHSLQYFLNYSFWGSLFLLPNHLSSGQQRNKEPESFC